MRLGYLLMVVLLLAPVAARAQVTAFTCTIPPRWGSVLDCGQKSYTVPVNGKVAVALDGAAHNVCIEVAILQAKTLAKVVDPFKVCRNESHEVQILNRSGPYEIVLKISAHDTLEGTTRSNITGTVTISAAKP